MKIVYKNPDDSVSLVTPAPIEHLMKVLGNDLTQEQYMDHVWERSVPENAVYPQWIEEEYLPDQYFLAAWRFIDSDNIEVDMDKAREVHMDNIRAVRNEKLQGLDIETLKGNDVQAQKQDLRDLPKTFDLTAASTPEELKKLWPDGLVP